MSNTAPNINFTNYNQLIQLAEQKFNELDKKDGKKDNKISNSVWNQYVSGFQNQGLLKTTQNSVKWANVKEQILKSVMFSQFTKDIKDAYLKSDPESFTGGNYNAAVYEEEAPLNDNITDDTHTSKHPVQEFIEINKIDINGLDIKDIIAKYDAIQNVHPDFTKDQIIGRIENYIKGLQYHVQETKFADLWRDDNENSDLKIENQAVKDAINNNDMDAFKTAFRQAAKEYIELYDNAEGDGKIDINELIAMEEKELGRTLTAQESEIVKEEAINRITMLDLDNDNTLNETEIAAYLWAMSKINDGQTGKTSYDITYNEWKTTQEALGTLSINQEYITQDDIDKLEIFRQTLKNGYNGLK